MINGLFNRLGRRVDELGVMAMTAPAGAPEMTFAAAIHYVPAVLRLVS